MAVCIENSLFQPSCKWCLADCVGKLKVGWMGVKIVLLLGRGGEGGV